jgi:hypothetical protein
MTSQSTQRSYTAGDIVPRTAQERADMQLRKLAGVSLTVIAAIDEMHQQAEAYCQQGTRSNGQQKVLLERAALVLHHFDTAAIRVQGQAFDGILNRTWEDPQPATRIVERIVEVPQKGIIGRLLGK